VKQVFGIGQTPSRVKKNLVGQLQMSSQEDLNKLSSKKISAQNDD